MAGSTPLCSQRTELTGLASPAVVINAQTRTNEAAVGVQGSRGRPGEAAWPSRSRSWTEMIMDGGAGQGTRSSAWRELISGIPALCEIQRRRWSRRVSCLTEGEAVPCDLRCLRLGETHSDESVSPKVRQLRRRRWHGRLPSTAYRLLIVSAMANPLTGPAGQPGYWSRAGCAPAGLDAQPGLILCPSRCILRVTHGAHHSPRSGAKLCSNTLTVAYCIG